MRSLCLVACLCVLTGSQAATIKHRHRRPSASAPAAAASLSSAARSGSALNAQFSRMESRLVAKLDKRLNAFETKLVAAERKSALRKAVAKGKGLLAMSLRKASGIGAGQKKPARRNAILGLAAGAHYAAPIKTFVLSLRKAGYKGDIVLGVIPEIKKALAAFIKQHRVTAVLVKSHKCRNPSMGNNCGDLSVGEAAINLARFQMYKKWIADYPDDTLVMITDVRDVYFQADPFPLLAPELAKGKDLFVFEEDIHHFNNTLGWSHPREWNFNRGWIWGCWGKKEVDRLKEKIVLCSGTTMATKAGLSRYLQVMLGEIGTRISYTDKQKYCPGWMNAKCDCRSGGIDQGYHNYLFHTGRFGDRTTSIKNTRGIVYTVGMICDNPKGVFKKALTLDKQGLVLRPDGKRAAVVHQADRCNRPRGWMG